MLLEACFVILQHIDTRVAEKYSYYNFIHFICNICFISLLCIPSAQIFFNHSIY